MKADPTSGLKKEKKSSAVNLQNSESEDKTLRKSSSSASKAAVSKTADLSKASKKVSEVKKATESTDEVDAPVDKKLSFESLPVDESNNRAKRTLTRPTPATTAAPAPTAGSSLVAARKKQLHEQQAKSSPINSAFNRDKKVSVKTIDTLSNKKPSLSSSLSDRVVKSSTEKLDFEKRVPPKTTAADRSKKPSTPVTTFDRQRVKASTERLDSINKRVSVKSFDATKPKVALAPVTSVAPVVTVATAAPVVTVATSAPVIAVAAEKNPTVEKVEQKSEQVRKVSQEVEEVGKSRVAKSPHPRTITKKSSSINVVLASQQQQQQQKKTSIRKESETIEPAIPEIESEIEKPEIEEAKKNPILSAILDVGSAENLSTRVNLSSASSLTSEQVNKQKQK